jgi:hypothetical protein
MTRILRRVRAISVGFGGKRIDEQLPPDREPRSVTVKVNPASDLIPVEGTDRRVEPAFRIPKSARGQGIVDPLRPMLFFKHGQDQFLVRRRDAELFHEVLTNKERMVHLVPMRSDLTIRSPVRSHRHRDRRWATLIAAPLGPG